MALIYLDFETRSQVDLKKVGVYVYAHHPSTEVLCTGYAIDDDEVQVARGVSEEVRAALYDETRPLPLIVAHNAQMEREILAAKYGHRLPWERFIDTAALAARMALPRKLEAVAQALKLDQQKDMAGHRIMLRLSRPKAGWNADEDDDGGFWEEDEKPQDFEALRAYCRDDVSVMREVRRRLLPLSSTEQRLYALTGRMNDRGVAVDLASVPPALALLEAATSVGEAEFKSITGGPGVKSYKKAAEALGLPNVKKVTVRNALRHGHVLHLEQTGNDGSDGFRTRVVRYPKIGSFPPRTLRALELFKRLARSSPAKLKAFRNRASADGRVRGALIYAGAERTTRWSSGGVQLHNLPRGLGEGTDTAFAALAADCIDICYDDAVGTIAEALRGFLVGPFLIGDYAQIEARALNWFAGQKDIIDLFAAKKDVYCHTASAIYKREITKKSEDPNLPPGVNPRFIGKTTELGAGYGLGWKKFQKQLDEVYDVQLETDFAIRIIETYRATHQKVVAWWDTLQRGFNLVVHRNLPRHQVDTRIAMGNVLAGGLRYAYIELPNGRRLYYAEPEMTADGVRYWGRNIYKGGAWDRVSTYGGKTAENIVQAFSRDILAAAMIRLEDAGFPLVLQVHDEIVSEADGIHLLDDLKSIMLQTPSWAEGLPIDVEVFQSHRYRK
jgi:DNA polymerase